MGGNGSTTRGRKSSVNATPSTNEKVSVNEETSTNKLPEVLLGMFGKDAQVDFGEKDKKILYYNVLNSNIKTKKGQMQYISTDGEHYTLGGDKIYDFNENQIQYLANMLFAVNRGTEISLPKKPTTKMLKKAAQQAQKEAQKEAQKVPQPQLPSQPALPQPPTQPAVPARKIPPPTPRPARAIPPPPPRPPPRPPAATTTTTTRSLQGVSQNEGAPNGLLGDVPTGTFEQISNAFGDVHTIGYGGSGATFLASLGAYEFLGLIGFLFFFALFVMKGIRACRKKKQWKAAEGETFQNEVGQESDSGDGYEVWEMSEMV